MTFPQIAAFGRKIPLAQLKSKGAPPKFSTWVRSVRWAYKLSPATFNLAATPGVKEIEVLDVALRAECKGGRTQALALEVLCRMIPNPCAFRLLDDDGQVMEEVVCPKASGGAFFGDSPQYRLCRGHGVAEPDVLSGVTTLESALVRWGAALAGMSAREGEGILAFAERHYRLESLRADLANLERKFGREIQLDRKYELAKERLKLQHDIAETGGSVEKRL